MKQRLIDANIARRKAAALIRLRAQTPEARTLGNAIMSMLGDARGRLGGFRGKKKAHPRGTRCCCLRLRA